MKILLDILENFEKAGLYPKLPEFTGSSTLPHVKVSGKDFLMFGSNNYLGLANNKKVIKKTQKLIKEHGMGPGGSRILSGNVDFLENFEKKLAEFVGVEATITFPTGYMANLAVIPAVMGPHINPEAKEEFVDGVIFSDQYNHATIVDGCRLTPAKKVIYKHNDLSDLSQEIEKFSGIKHRLIISESVYSTEGLVTDVDSIVGIAQQSESLLMIDDAHGIGILGENGGGAIKQFKEGKKIDIYMASFDKALGTTGGFIGGSKRFIDYLRIASRPYIFSSALPVASAAATWAVIEELEGGSDVREKTQANAKRLRTALQEAGFTVMGNGMTPAIPLYIGDDATGIRFAEKMFELGIYVPCFRWPAAPAGKSRLRISVMASHSDMDLDRFVEAANKIGKELKVI